MEILDSIARRYGTRPSELVGEDEPFRAMSIDLHAHNAGATKERKERWEMEQRLKRGRR